MSISAQIIADSINPCGNRLTSYVLEYPRFIHSEMMTHRVFSRNASSSRAIPIERVIQQTLDNPALPVWWGRNQSGMQAKEELPSTPSHDEQESKQECARRLWLEARDSAVRAARALAGLGLHKQIVNRVLEPWHHIRVILSGTEFENFFALRAHRDAQPEIQELARLMLDAYNVSSPRELQPGEWHIPFGQRMDERRLTELVRQPETPSPAALLDLKLRVAIARCARVSYYNFDGKDDYAADLSVCERLFGSTPRHLSPTEHVAQCLGVPERVGNFTGWRQYRYNFADQRLSDPRVRAKQRKAA